MLRALFRVILVIVILVAIGAFFIGYRWASPSRDAAAPATERPAATTGRVDVDRARETGAAIGEKVAVGAAKAGDVLSDAALTTKVKSKIALDDTLDGTRISVNTDGTTVTLSGYAATAAQKARALQLARETEGVTSVRDKIDVE